MLFTKITAFKREGLGEVRATIINDDIWICAKDLTDIMGIKKSKFVSIPDENKNKVLYSDVENPIEVNFPLAGLFFVDRNGLQMIYKKHPNGQNKIKLRKFVSGEVIPGMMDEQERLKHETAAMQEQAEKDQELLNSLQLFKNPDFGNLRATAKDGEAWLFGKDVAEMLGYSNVSSALSVHVDEEDKISSNELLAPKQGFNRKTRLKPVVKGSENPDTADNFNDCGDFGKRGGWFINESGLYSLILASKLPKAKEFKRWITSEVLPSIRKHGGYVKGQETLSDAEILSRAIMVSQNILREREAKIAALEQENEKLLPAAQYCRDVLQSDEVLNVTTIAKEFGYSAKEFNMILKNLGIQYYQNGLWVLKKPYDDKGYTKVQTYVYSVDECGNAKTKTRTCWTQAGRMFLHSVMDEANGRAIM